MSSQPKQDPKWTCISDSSDEDANLMFTAAMESLADFRMFGPRKWVPVNGETPGYYEPVKEMIIVSMEGLEELINNGECRKPWDWDKRNERFCSLRDKKWFLLLETEIAKRPQQFDAPVPTTTTYGVFIQCLREFENGWRACRKNFPTWHEAENQREADAAKEVKRLERLARKFEREVHQKLERISDWEAQWLRGCDPYTLINELHRREYFKDADQHALFDACVSWNWSKTDA